MEDYFVIVLGVIWLAISLYKKGVKKETKGSDAIEEVAKKRSGFMDSLFEELIGVKADDHNYVDDGDDEAKNFNLREAIIYSEIVNRPYK